MRLKILALGVLILCVALALIYSERISKYGIGWVWQPLASAPPLPPKGYDYSDSAFSVVCPEDRTIDAGPILSNASKKLYDLWWVTTPQSDASIMSTEGAIIAMYVYGTCYVHSPMTIPGGLQNAKIVIECINVGVLEFK